MRDSLVYTQAVGFVMFYFSLPAPISFARTPVCSLARSLAHSAIYGSTLFCYFSLAFVYYTRFFVAYCAIAVNVKPFFPTRCVFRRAKRGEAIMNTHTMGSRDNSRTTAPNNKREIREDNRIKLAIHILYILILHQMCIKMALNPNFLLCVSQTS